jgi:hypothetical protein
MRSRSVLPLALSGVLGLAAALGCGGGGDGSRAPAAPQELAAPSDLSAFLDPFQSNLVHLAWKGSTQDVLHFDLQARVGTEAFQSIVQDGLLPGWRSVDLTLASTLPEVSEVAFRLRALGSTATSPFSNTVTVPYGLMPPDRVSAGVVYSSVWVDWSNWTHQADRILLERGCSPDGGLTFTWEEVASLPPGDDHYGDDHPPESPCLVYRVSACKGATKVL